MAVTDLWHKTGKKQCPLCGQNAGPPSVRHGRGLRWRVAVPGHPSEHFREKGRAQRREVALWNTPRRKSDRSTVGDMVDAWLTTKEGLSDKGIEAARYGASLVRERWAGVRLEEVTDTDVQHWIDTLRSPLGPASLSARHKALQCIKGALKLAEKRKLIAEHPAPDVRVRPQQVREGRFLSLEELGLIADRIDQHHEQLGYRRESLSAMLWTLGTTGARIDEGCRANVGNVDRVRRRLRIVKSKSGKARDVPIPKFVMQMLDLGRGRDEPLFVAPKSGRRVHKDVWRAKWFAPAVEAAGLGDVRPHDLRHTAASLAIANGASILDVSRMLGHESPAFTLRVYGHLVDGHLDDIAARMDAAWSTLPGKDAEQST